MLIIAYAKQSDTRGAHLLYKCSQHLPRLNWDTKFRSHSYLTFVLNSLFREILETREKALGENHPGVATAVNNLAVLMCQMVNYHSLFYAKTEIIAVLKKTNILIKIIDM